MMTIEEIQLVMVMVQAHGMGDDELDFGYKFESLAEGEEFDFNYEFELFMESFEYDTCDMREALCELMDNGFDLDA